MAINPFTNMHDDSIESICSWLPLNARMRLMGADKRLYEVTANDSVYWLFDLKRLQPCLYAAYKPDLKRETPYAIFRAIMLQAHAQIPDNIPARRYVRLLRQRTNVNCRFFREREHVFYLVGDAGITVQKKFENRQITIPFENPMGSQVRAVHFCFPRMFIHSLDGVLRCVNVETHEVTPFTSRYSGMRVRDKELFCLDWTSSIIEVWDLSQEKMQLVNGVNLLNLDASRWFDIYKDQIIYLDDRKQILSQDLKGEKEAVELAFDPYFDRGGSDINCRLVALKVEGDRLVLFYNAGPVPTDSGIYYELGCCILDLTGRLQLRYGNCIRCSETSRIKEIQIENNILYYTYEDVAEVGRSRLRVCKIEEDEEGIEVNLGKDASGQDPVSIYVDSFQLRMMGCLSYTADLSERGGKLNTGVISARNFSAPCLSSFQESKLNATLEVLNGMRSALERNDRRSLKELGARIPLYSIVLKAFSLHYSGSQEPSFTVIERVRNLVLVKALIHAVHEENRHKMAFLWDTMGPAVVSHLFDVIRSKLEPRLANLDTEGLRRTFCFFDFMGDAPEGTFPSVYGDKTLVLQELYSKLMSQWSGKLFCIPALGLNFDQDYVAAKIEPILESDRSMKSLRIFKELSLSIEPLEIPDAALLEGEERSFFMGNWRLRLQGIIGRVNGFLHTYPPLQPRESAWQDEQMAAVGVYTPSAEGFRAHAQKLAELLRLRCKNKGALELFLRSEDAQQCLRETNTLIADFNGFMRATWLKKFRELRPLRLFPQ